MMLFGEISQEHVQRRVGGRTRSSYLNVLRADLNYLNSGTTSLGDLNKFMGLAFSMGPPHAKHELLKLKPDSTKGSTVKLVNERTRVLVPNKDVRPCSLSERRSIDILNGPTRKL